MIFVSNILMASGKFEQDSCQDLNQLIPTSLSSTSDGDNSTGVCPDVVNPSPSLRTTISPMFESSSSQLIVSISSSSNVHTTVEHHTIIVATPTSYFPHSTPISYSSISSIINKQPRFTTGPMNMYSSSLVTVTSSSSVTYTLPYSSPIPTLATPTLIHVSHTNGSVSQTSARSSLTSPGATPSPTMLFCSESSEDGKWPQTPSCTNATSTNCGNNSSHANG